MLLRSTLLHGNAAWTGSDKELDAMALSARSDTTETCTIAAEFGGSHLQFTRQETSSIRGAAKAAKISGGNQPRRLNGVEIHPVAVTPFAFCLLDILSTTYA